MLAPVWHPSLQNNKWKPWTIFKLESVRLPCPHVDYKDGLKVLEISSLEESRVTLCIYLFKKIQEPSDKLFRMLPYEKEFKKFKERSSIPIA